MNILWQDQDLHDENAEEYQAGTGDVIFEGRQGRCSILQGIDTLLS